MDIGRMHEMLAEISHSFSVDVLARGGTSAKIDEALRRHGKLAQRHSPLRPTFVAWLILAMTLFREKSIPNVMAQLIAAARGKRPAIPLKPVTDSAISQARARMGPEPMRGLFRSLAEEVRPDGSFQGFRVWSVDGTHLTMPDTPSNERAFGRPKASRGRSAWPQMKAVMLTDTVTHRVRDAAFGGSRESERELAKPLLATLGEGDLALIDAGLYSALTVHDLHARGARFLARLPAHVKPKLVKRLGPGDYLVEIKGRRPAAAGTYKPPRGPSSATEPFTMTVRLVAYKVEGEEDLVRLVTDLLDPDEVGAKEVALLYHERWESEVSYDEVKVHLQTVKHGKQHTEFRSKSPPLVEQEFWAMLATYNLVRELMLDAARAHDIPPRELSFVDSLVVIGLTLPEVQSAPDRRLPFLRRRLLADIADCRLDRPRRPRVYDRVVKVKMSNYGLKRPHHRQRFRDIAKALTLVEAGVEQLR